MKQPLLSDPLLKAKTICQLCGKAHLHGPYDRERQLSINRWYRWQRIKDLLPALAVPVGFLSFITLGAVFSPRYQPLTPQEQREQLRIKHRVEQIDDQMDKLQSERDELDPPDEPDPPDWG
jgi:hypothetical protein